MTRKKTYLIELDGGSGSHYNMSEMFLTKKELKFLKKFQKVFNRDNDISDLGQRQDNNGSVRIYFEEVK
jgi:hypothetical protein